MKRVLVGLLFFILFGFKNVHAMKTLLSCVCGSSEVADDDETYGSFSKLAQTPDWLLYQAVEHNKPDQVRKILKNTRVNPDAVWYSARLLVRAVGYGYKEVVRELVEGGACPELPPSSSPRHLEQEMAEIIATAIVTRKKEGSS